MGTATDTVKVPAAVPMPPKRDPLWTFLTFDTHFSGDRREVTELFLQLGIWRLLLLVALLASIPPLLWLLWVQLYVVVLTYDMRVMAAAQQIAARQVEAIDKAAKAWQKSAQLDYSLDMKSAQEWRRSANEEHQLWKIEIGQARKAFDREQADWRRRVAKETKIRIPFTQDQRLEVFRRDGFQCRQCGYQAEDGRGRKLHVDHIIPVSMGGTNDLGNLQTLCDMCNLRKRDKLPDEFKGARYANAE